MLTRSLHEDARWGTQPSAATDYGRKAEETPEPARADFTFFAELEPRPILARIALTSTSTASAASPTSSPRRSCARSSRARCAGAVGLDVSSNAVDRDEIERQDFPAARRGYDAAAVHEHLRRVADEFEALAARPRSASLAEGDVDAGPLDPRGGRVQRTAAARRRRSRGERARRARRGGGQGAARQARSRAGRARPPADRPEVDRRVRSPARSTSSSRDVGTLGATSEAAPGRSRRAAGNGARSDDEAGARLVALNMALEGTAARGDRPLPRRAFRARRRRDAARRRLHERRQVTAAPAELAALHERAAILADLGHIHSLLFWDQNTMMPPRRRGRPRRPLGDARVRHARAAHRSRAGPAARRARAMGGRGRTRMPTTCASCASCGATSRRPFASRPASPRS